MILRTTFQENLFKNSLEPATETQNKASSPFDREEPKADLEDDLLELKKDLENQFKNTIEGSGRAVPSNRRILPGHLQLEEKKDDEHSTTGRTGKAKAVKQVDPKRVGSSKQAKLAQSKHEKSGPSPGCDAQSDVSLQEFDTFTAQKGQIGPLKEIPKIVAEIGRTTSRKN